MPRECTSITLHKNLGPMQEGSISLEPKQILQNIHLTGHDLERSKTLTFRNFYLSFLFKKN